MTVCRLPLREGAPVLFEERCDDERRCRNGRSVEAHGSLDGNVLSADRVTVDGNAGQPDNSHKYDPDRDDNGDDDVEFTGRIQSMTGAAPNLTLMVNGRTVMTSSETVLRRRGSVVGFDALRVNREVEVEGSVRSDGVVLAGKITLEDDGDEAQEVEWMERSTAYRP